MVNLSNPFDDKRLNKAKSALIKVIPDDQGRYEFELISQYTRSGLNSLQVGDLIGVQNYSMSGNGNGTYSILSLTQVLPVHFATQGQNAYPGHTFISMKSIKEDWESQVDEAHYATTTITCKAVPTGWQFNYDPLLDALPLLKEDNNLPMVGAEIRPLNESMVEAIINQGMNRENESPLVHKKFDSIQLKMDERALLTTHFGIFGFTGVGKSNFVSSLVTSINKNLNTPVNVVIVDPNDEYLGLFIDHFSSINSKIKYINVGTKSLPNQIMKKLSTNNFDEQDIQLFYKQLHLPHDLKRDTTIHSFVKAAVGNALKNTFIAIPGKNLSTFVLDKTNEYISGGTGAKTIDAIYDFMYKCIETCDSDQINAATLHCIIDHIKMFKEVKESNPINELSSSTQNTANSVVNATLKSLESFAIQLNCIPAAAIVSMEKIIEELNENDSNQIIIITGHNIEELKRFSSEFGNELYESRRINAVLEPMTLFFLDESDIFIPLISEDKSTLSMKDMCITLARRGRKFGLGLGIATQRVTMLDTQIMGNLHTYYVSRLPRKYDRSTVAEAFGISEEELSPTFTFKAGNWLVLSHDATGLKGVPIPTTAINANDRIKEAAKRYNLSEEDYLDE